MSILMKIVLGIGAVLLIVGSTCITIAALWKSRTNSGEGKASPRQPFETEDE